MNQSYESVLRSLLGAESLRRIGAANSLNGQDTRLVHVNPKEEAMLKRRGGSGRVDPVTGLRHYEENDDNSGYNDDGGWNDSSDRSSRSNDGGGVLGGIGAGIAKGISGMVDKSSRQAMGLGAQSEGGDSIFDTSGYLGSGYDLPANDTWNKNYAALGDQAVSNWQAAEPDAPGLGSVVKGVFTKGASIPGDLKKLMDYMGWKGQDPRREYSSGYGTKGNLSGDKNGDGRLSRTELALSGGTGATGGTGGGVGGSGGVGTGSSLPGVYTDPITGRLLYESSIPYGTSNKAYKDQLLLDEIMGTDVAKQNVTQNILTLQRQIEDVRAKGGDTRWYEQELQRLQELAGSDVGMDNPLLAYLNSGLREQVMNTQLDNAVANTMRSSEDAAARRGLGTSSMQDKLRASLGLSTAQARNENKLSAQEQDFQTRLALMNYLTGDLGQTYQQEMGKTSIPMTFADWENQRQIAEMAANTANSQFSQNLSYLKDQQSDANRNAWIAALGEIGGNIDWDSIF